MSKYKVAAYCKGRFVRWASGVYDSPDAAEDYCKACAEKCSPMTKLEYKVKQV